MQLARKIKIKITIKQRYHSKKKRKKRGKKQPTRAMLAEWSLLFLFTVLSSRNISLLKKFFDYSSILVLIIDFFAHTTFSTCEHPKTVQSQFIPFLLNNIRLKFIFNDRLKLVSKQNIKLLFTKLKP